MSTMSLRTCDQPQRRHWPRRMVWLALAVAFVAVVSAIWLVLFFRPTVFEAAYPLKSALATIEQDGLLLAIHDFQTLEDGGCFIISSVRGTPDFLRQYPPRRRILSFLPFRSMLDVAEQSVEGTRMTDLYFFMLAKADDNGVQYAWWFLLPRKFYRVVDGKRVPAQDLLYSEEHHLLAMPATKVRAPLSAWYRDDRLRDAKGVQKEVTAWFDLPVQPGSKPATLAAIAAKTRRDMALMMQGSIGALYGASSTKPGFSLVTFDPESVTDIAYETAVRKHIEMYGDMDEVKDLVKVP